MNTVNLLWQIFNSVMILVLVILIFVFAKMIKSYAKKEGKRFWEK